MSHKTLVNGTVYEVDGGKTLIDGVAYSIDKGKTLVGGTAYEVGFAKPATVTVTGEDFLGEGYYEGSIYYSTADGNTGSLSSVGTYELPVGTTIKIDCLIYDRGYGMVEHNGDYVISESGDSSGKTDAYYSFELVSDTTLNYYCGSMDFIITITES